MAGGTSPVLDRTLRTLLGATAFAIPLSVKVFFPGVDLEIIFPAEPLIGATFLLALKAMCGKRRWSIIDRTFVRQPISIAVLVYLVASLVSVAFSSMPLVSVKAFVVRLSYAVLFYFLIGSMPVSGRYGATGLLKNYVVAFLPILVFAFSNQVEGGLDRASAGFVSFPFYVDHTIFSAAMVFVLFMGLAATARAYAEDSDRGKVLAYGVISAALVVGLFLSYSRAAWISALLAVLIAVAFGLWRFERRLALLFGVALLVGAWSVGQHFMQADRIRVDASAYGSGARESVLSLANTTTDPSNVERLNRWSCAWRMFLDRPLTGFGPGTYQFQYLNYQLPEETSSLSIVDTAAVGAAVRYMTGPRKVLVRISPMVIQHSGGTAHSEYLLALSESGPLAFGSLIALLLLAQVAAIRC
ncbi:MAG: O-antigen ligase family protein, partial [Flavobacteriales bacterium]